MKKFEGLAKIEEFRGPPDLSDHCSQPNTCFGDYRTVEAIRQDTARREDELLSKNPELIAKYITGPAEERVQRRINEAFVGRTIVSARMLEGKELPDVYDDSQVNMAMEFTFEDGGISHVAHWDSEWGGIDVEVIK